MGRGKLAMELISNEKSRNATYNKRKRGLKKKLCEFTTLCGVDACMIIYGPFQEGGNHQMELDTWPSKSDKVMSIISKYKSKRTDEKARGSCNISNFFERQKQKIDHDIVKIRRANAKDKFPKWDINVFDQAPVDQLFKAVASIDGKLAYANCFLELLKENKRLMEGGAQKMMDCSNMQLIEADNQLIAASKPLDVFTQQSSSHDHNYAQFNGFCGSSSINQYTSLAANMVQNVMNKYKNPGTSSIGYYDSPIIRYQPLQHFVERPIVSNASHMMMMTPSNSEVPDPQVNDDFDLTNFQFMSQRAGFFGQGFNSF